MTADELIAWRGSRSRADAAMLLGVSDRSLLRWELHSARYPIPPYVDRVVQYRDEVVALRERNMELTVTIARMATDQTRFVAAPVHNAPPSD